MVVEKVLDTLTVKGFIKDVWCWLNLKNAPIPLDAPQ
jgi:hypothetical protein